jgi:hypothetical protein
MNISMRTTVHDLVRALRWQRSDLLDAVMVRKSFKEPPSAVSARAMLRRAKLKRKARTEAGAT